MLEADKQRRAEIALHAVQGWNLDRLAGYISGMGIKPSHIRHRSRDSAVSDPRKAFAYLGHRKDSNP